MSYPVSQNRNDYHRPTTLIHFPACYLSAEGLDLYSIGEDDVQLMVILFYLGVNIHKDPTVIWAV